MKLRMSWLDLKLAGRMLSKYPGLTLVGGFSIAFAIAVAAMAFEFVTQLVYPSLPVPGGDRIVALRMWDAAASRPERRALHEFMLWRDELRSVDDIGIFSLIERNLRWRGVAGAPVRGAAISEAAFRVAGVPAQLGRTLVAADEALGAAPVVVLGHDVWRGAFASTPDIVGTPGSRGRRAAHGGRCHARGLRVPDFRELLGSVPVDLVELSDPGGPADSHLRPSRAGREPGGGASRADDRDPAGRARESRHAPAVTGAGAALPQRGDGHLELRVRRAHVQQWPLHPVPDPDGGQRGPAGLREGRHP